MTLNNRSMERGSCWSCRMNMYLGFLTAVIAWQLVCGSARGSWWFPGAKRRDNPRVYLVVVAIQCAILIAFLMTAKTWNVR
jgi:hypothetical protein